MTILRIFTLANFRVILARFSLTSRSGRMYSSIAGLQTLDIH